jgi:Zn-dependent protease
MTSSVTLFRVAGIRVGIHWSWLVVFGLITWSLAATVFPDQNPGLGDGTYVAMAIAASVLFFTSLLLHELGHAFQARREGMEIEGITLWLFGGVAQFRGMFPSAGAEFRIGIAGPLVSLVLGAGFVGLALAITGVQEVDGIAAWLGYINLALLVFNLLPALPLDGGRVLRSALWGLRGDFAWATRVAAAIGRGFGALMIAGGVALFFFSELATNGLWLALLGWFLFGAATEEARYGQVYGKLAGLRVRDLMVRSPTTVSPDQTIGELMDGIAWTDRQDAYPVVEGGRPVGLLPFRLVSDVPRSEWDTHTVRESMLPVAVIPVLASDESLEQAARSLSGGLGRGLVVDDGHLAGLISLDDLARAVESGRGRGRR